MLKSQKETDLSDVLTKIRDLMLGADVHTPSHEFSAPLRDPVEKLLYERIKELSCLHGINKIVFQYGDSLEKVLSGIVELLPEALQHTEEASAQILFSGRVYSSSLNIEMCARIDESIFINGKEQGQITFGYGPSIAGDAKTFLKEERLLLATVADHVGLVIHRAQTKEALLEANTQLNLERQTLRETNMALRALTDRLVDEKRAIGESIRMNMANSVAPILERLQHDLPGNKVGRVRLLKHCLEDLVSPFVKDLRVRSPGLTPTEQVICLSIRGGLTSKEIASLRGISAGTVNRHRENIRRKLGLRGSKQNLVSYLKAMDNLGT